MITKATKNQWLKIDQLKEKWIEKQTDQFNNVEIEKTVRRMWSRLTKKKPIVLIADSPYSCILWYTLTSILIDNLDSQLHSQLHSQLNSQLHSQLDSQLRSQLNSQLRSQLRSQLYIQLSNQLDSQLNSQLNSQLRSQLSSQLYIQLSNQLNSQLSSQLGSQLNSQLYSQNLNNISYYNSWWWSVWTGWYQGAKILGVKFDSEKLNLLTDWSWHCPFVICYENLVIVSRRPKKIYWENNVLHNNKGASVEFQDGEKIWTINGVQVTQQIVENPEIQTLTEINKEENEEVKRIRIERYGWTKYLAEVNAKVKDHRKNEIEGTEEALMKCNKMTILVPICPSTGRIYGLEVPNEINSCENAQQWLRGNKQGFSIGAS